MIALIDRIAQFAARHEMFAPGGRIGVAASGGSDSVFLLYALRELAPRWNLQLSVVHIEHGIRGEASLADAEFVRNLAEQFGLPFHLHSAHVSACDSNLEQAARESRIGFYRELLESGRLDRIATGHTRSDQAETVLYRVLRGSGLAGLVGILPVAEPGLVRPLLELTRAEIQDWLCQHGIAWREDETNQDRSYARNRLRHEVLPMLADSLNPRVEEALANLATLARDEEFFWQGWLADKEGMRPHQWGRGTQECVRHNSSTGQPLVIPITDLTGHPIAVARRKIRLLIQSIKGDLRQIEFAHVERILEMAQSADGHDRVQIPGVDVLRSFEWLRFSKLPAQPTERDFSLPLPAPGFAELPCTSLRITLQMQEKPADTDAYVTVTNELDLERLRLTDSSVPTLELRNWRPGDKYRPVGRSQEEKIKVLFQEGRIPLWDRRHWPIITYNGIILWTRRFGVAADFAASPGARVVLRIDESG